MIDPPAEQVRLGSFVLDLARGEVLHDAQHVPLRRQAFDTLRYLIENSGRIVSKTELARAVSTSDAAIVQCIKDIRNALGAEGDRMIRTVPRAGYQFKGELLTPSPEAGTQHSHSEHAALARWMARRPILATGLAFTAGAALTGTLVLVWFMVSSPSHPDANVSTFADTCSQGKLACMRTGGEEETCEGRRQRCLATGCWMGGLVQRCGYEKK